MFKKLSFSAVVVISVGLFSGCASVPMVQGAQSSQAKTFGPPPEGKAGLYIYRDSSLGAALKKDIWVDGECIGQSAPKVFFYTTVSGDVEHKISTESEFSPNDIELFTKSGINYFIRQAIKLGVFVGGAKLEVVDATKGEAAVRELGEAAGGTCSK
jgi:hypothetical protein